MPILDPDKLPTASSLGERFMQALEQVQDKLLHLVASAPLLLVALLIVLFASWLGGFISRRMRVVKRLSSTNPYMEGLLRSTVRIVITVAGVVVALDLLNATSLVGAVLGSAGVIGLVLGFGFKDIAENYIAGVLLSLRKPFSPGDTVRIDSFEGKVVALTARATILMTHDGNHLTFPNAIVFKAVILNLTRNGNRRFDFLVDLNPEIDLAAALRVGLDAVSSAPGVLAEPKPFVQLNQLGRDVVQLQFFAWVDQRRANFGLARSEALRRARLQLERIGAYFGPPQLRLVTTQAAPSPQRAVTAPPEVAEAHDERQAVDEAIEKTRSEMGSSDLLRSDARE